MHDVVRLRHEGRAEAGVFQDLPQLGDVSDAVVEGVLTLRKEAMGVIEQARRDGYAWRR